MRMTRRTLFCAATTAGLSTGAPGTGAESQSGISLAAWSLAASFFAGRWKLLDLPRIMRTRLQIDGLEHVNQFFENPTLRYLQKFQRNCSDAGVRSLLLMIDDEGQTAAPDRAARQRAAVAHRKWIDIAALLGCHSVRCNVNSGLEDWQNDSGFVERAAETMHSLLDYARGSGLNILVENHGHAASSPETLLALVAKVNHPKFGLLVDLGNWNPGEDRYSAVRKTIRHGRALSVKGTWGADRDPAFDLEKLVRTALEGGYKGWWAIESGARQRREEKLSAGELFEREVQSVLEAKAIVERVVFKPA